MSFQAITNFLLNSNSVNLQDNLINLQSDDFNNSKISNYSLSKTETFSDVLASYSSKTSKEENYSSDILKNEAKVQYDEKAGKDINEASKQSEIEKKDSVAEEKSNSSVENVENKETKSNDEVKNASETEKDSKKDKKVEKKVVLIKDESAVEANFELNQNVQVKSDEQKNQKLSAKDFSRINELGNVENKVQEVAKDEIPVDELNLLVKKDAKSKDNVQNQNEDAKIAFFNKNDGEIELELTKNDSSSQSKLDFSSQNEQQQKSEGKIRYTRVDSDVIEKLIAKENAKQVDLNANEQDALISIFSAQLPENDKNNFIVSFESLSANSQPTYITQNEFMRRMKEMSAAQSGMNFYGEMPDSYNFVVNTEHPLIKRILADEKEQCDKEVTPITNKINELENQRKSLQGDKKDSDLDATTKDEIKKIDDEIASAKSEKKSIYSKYSSENKEVRQLVDLALLSNNLLKGEALSAFVKRSIEMM